MRLEDLVVSPTKLSHEELMARVHSIREGRVQPAKPSATKSGKRKTKRKNALDDLFAGMSEEEQLKLLAELQKDG